MNKKVFRVLILIIMECFTDDHYYQLPPICEDSLNPYYNGMFYRQQQA